ncbi:MAG: hypothetical protein WCP97_06530 [bacterium]
MSRFDGFASTIRKAGLDEHVGKITPERGFREPRIKTTAELMRLLTPKSTIEAHKEGMQLLHYEAGMMLNGAQLNKILTARTHDGLAFAAVITEKGALVVVGEGVEVLLGHSKRLTDAKIVNHRVELTPDGRLAFVTIKTGNDVATIMHGARPVNPSDAGLIVVGERGIFGLEPKSANDTIRLITKGTLAVKTVLTA